MYAGHKRLVEKKSLFFPGKMPPCPARTVQPAHLPASSPSSASPGLPPPLGAAHAISPDARCGHPALSLARRKPRFAGHRSAAGGLVVAPLGFLRRSIGMGCPSLPPVAQVFNLCVAPLRIRSTGCQPVCLSAVCLSGSPWTWGNPERHTTRSPRPYGRSACRGERPTKACRAGGGWWRRAPTRAGSDIASRTCR
jgi:hypothetical protein